MVVTKKTEAILKAVGIYLALNALVYGGTYILLLVVTSPIGSGWRLTNQLNLIHQHIGSYCKLPCCCLPLLITDIR